MIYYPNFIETVRFPMQLQNGDIFIRASNFFKMQFFKLMFSIYAATTFKEVKSTIHDI